MVSVSASLNLPFHHKVQKFSSCIGYHPGGPGKKRKTVVWCGAVALLNSKTHMHKRVVTFDVLAGKPKQSTLHPSTFNSSQFSHY